jgi:hypothetical protein
MGSVREIVVLLIGCLLWGCSSVVVPPQYCSEEMETVFLVDVSVTHTALALPAENAPGQTPHFTMWGFGDREYMAMNNEGMLRSAWLAIPFVFSRGALERQDLTATTGAAIQREIGARDVIELRVGKERTVRLREMLEVQFDRLKASYFIRHPNGKTYVPTPKRYNLWGLFGCDNCNGAVAGWLRELGCRVPRRFPRWRIWREGQRENS